MIERAWFFISTSGNLERLASGLTEQLGSGDIAGAERMARASRSVEAAVVLAGLTHSARGADAASEAMASATAMGRMRLERRLSFLGTLGNNAPFVGLLGTVIGIVQAFHEFERAGVNGAANSGIMGAIAEALVATANVALPVDVELVLREPPPPPPEPIPEPALPEAPKAAAPPVLAKAVPPPPAARAGAVVTALPDAAQTEPAEPFDFTSDPNSHVYGAGVVAVSGRASHGLAGAQLGGRGTEPVRAPSRGDALTAVGDLSQRPRLRVQDPCRGFFPAQARDDVAVVSVRVVIGKGGDVASASVVSESPPKQGFGAAARACMLDQTFTPALDRAGRPAATALAVNVKFSR